MSQEVEDTEQRITRRLRELRLERGLTLEKVAAAADLSPGYLSRVESGQRIPSIGTLVLLARALDVSVADLASDEEPGSPIVRHDDATKYGSRGAELMHLSPPASGSLIEATRVVLRGRATPPRPVRHGGEEWLHVVTGRLELVLAGEMTILEPGDSAQFPGATEHVLRGAPDAEVIVVIASPRTGRIS
ncbi:helix-turn-helix domain-containing protein [Saccharopolyspora shandongensis]|uniref:helix-turn-helix domain-containing protein n=1 Tax=Saccharopolyspora shandongensis TaxID=418495 RepID=UPI00340C1259